MSNRNNNHGRYDQQRTRGASQRRDHYVPAAQVEANRPMWQWATIGCGLIVALVSVWSSVHTAQKKDEELALLRSHLSALPIHHRPAPVPPTQATTPASPPPATTPAATPSPTTNTRTLEPGQCDTRVWHKGATVTSYGVKSLDAYTVASEGKEPMLASQMPMDQWRIGENVKMCALHRIEVRF